MGLFSHMTKCLFYQIKRKKTAIHNTILGFYCKIGMCSKSQATRLLAKSTAEAASAA